MVLIANPNTEGMHVGGPTSHECVNFTSSL
jgi:hypothetical protein